MRARNLSNNFHFRLYFCHLFGWQSKLLIHFVSHNFQSGRITLGRLRRRRSWKAEKQKRIWMETTSGHSNKMWPLANDERESRCAISERKLRFKKLINWAWVQVVLRGSDSRLAKRLNLINIFKGPLTTHFDREREPWKLSWQNSLQSPSREKG